MQQELRQLFIVQLAALVKRFPAFDAETFHPRLDRNAAGATEKLDQIRLPQINARLHAELNRPLNQSFQQVATRQKDLVDEVEVGHSLSDQRVYLREYLCKFTLPVGIAIIDFRTETAGEGAAAGGFHFGPRPYGRAIEAMMMMPVSLDPFIRPGEGRMGDEQTGLSPPVLPQLALFQPGDSRLTVGVRGVGKGRHHLLALAHHHQIHSKLFQRGPRCGGAMRTHCDKLSATTRKCAHQRQGHPQLRRRTAPEKVAWRGRDNRHVRAESRDLFRHLLDAATHEVAVNQEYLVPLATQKSGAIAQFERQMRVLASEVNTALEAPGGIDQRDPHAGTPPTRTS